MASKAYMALRLLDAPDIQLATWSADGRPVLKRRWTENAASNVSKAFINSILNLARTPEPRKVFSGESSFFSDTELYLQSRPTFAALKSPALSEYR